MPLNMFKPSSNIFFTAVLLFWIFLLYMFHVCIYYAVLFITCSLATTYLTLVWDVFLCFCHFPILCVGSGVVLNYIDSWSLPSSLILDILWLNTVIPFVVIVWLSKMA